MKAFALVDFIFIITLIALSIHIGVLIAPYAKTMTQGWSIEDSLDNGNKGLPPSPKP